MTSCLIPSQIRTFCHTEIIIFIPEIRTWRCSSTFLPFYKIPSPFLWIRPSLLACKRTQFLSSCKFIILSIYKTVRIPFIKTWILSMSFHKSSLLILWNNRYICLLIPSISPFTSYKITSNTSGNVIRILPTESPTYPATSSSPMIRKQWPIFSPVFLSMTFLTSGYITFLTALLTFFFFYES